MKIIQSFWSGNKDCLKDGYGWLNPIYGSSDILRDAAIMQCI